MALCSARWKYYVLHQRRREEVFKGAREGEEVRRRRGANPMSSLGFMCDGKQSVKNKDDHFVVALS